MLKTLGLGKIVVFKVLRGGVEGWVGGREKGVRGDCS